MKVNKYRPKVTIVIPAYNAANYLAEAVESAINQTYENIEIIVVNDGSNDNGATADVAKKYRNSIRYIEKGNGGSSSALNCGILNMTGEWFSWLSHDDLYCPDKVEKQVDFMNQLEVSKDELANHIFFTASQLINENGANINKVSMRKNRERSEFVESIEGNQYFVAEPTKYNFYGCGCLIHKHIFEKIGLFDENLRLLNDIDMWYRIYINNYKVHYIPEVLVKGRVHSKQISNSIGYSYHNDEQDMFWNRSLQWLKNNYPNDERLFYLYGRNAFLKTRNKEGDKAFDVVIRSSPNMRLILNIQKSIFKGSAKLRLILKKVYMMIMK